MAESGTSFSKVYQPARKGKRGPSKKTLAQAAFARLGYSPIECQILIAMQLMTKIEKDDKAKLNVDKDVETLIKVNAKLIEFESARPAAELDLDITTDGEALITMKPLSSVELLVAQHAMEQKYLG